MVLPYIEQIIGHPGRCLIHNVLFNEDLRELLKVGYVAVRQAHKPLHRRSLERTHEHLAVNGV